VLSTRDAKQKIRTVRSIQQICRAMKTVASIRLRRAEQRLISARPYREQVAALAARIAAVTQAHPFLEVRPVERVALVVVASDRGLAGGYNANAIRQALHTAGPEQSVVIPVGRRAQVQMASRGYLVRDGVSPLGGEPEVAAIWRLAGNLGAMYTRGEVDQVTLVYTRFLGGTRSQVTSEVILPVIPKGEVGGDAIFEPAPEQLLAGLLDRYLRSQVLGAVLEASASEHGARVAAMTLASDNAEDLIRTLTQAYNKARQASITREIAEIVGASEATA
jgi:F-type H+-transporting ATPase subunit gamma